MALWSKCTKCPKMVRHSANKIPICDDCSGRNDAVKKEAERWAALTDSQKIEELLKRVQGLERRQFPRFLG